jgi:hypothetical protein
VVFSQVDPAEPVTIEKIGRDMPSDALMLFCEVTLFVKVEVEESVNEYPSVIMVSLDTDTVYVKLHV